MVGRGIPRNYSTRSSGIFSAGITVAYRHTWVLKQCGLGNYKPEKVAKQGESSKTGRGAPCSYS